MKILRYVLILISIFFLALPVIFYLSFFNGLTISENPTDWGPFGDFFGGIINSYISLLTLIITIFIAYEVSKLDEKRNAKVLEFDKKRFLNELRESEYRRISLELQKVSTSITKPDGKMEIFAVNLHVRHFAFGNKHLFPFLDDKETTELIKTLDSVTKIYFTNVDKEGQKEIFEKYINAVMTFSTKIQEFIIEEL